MPQLSICIPTWQRSEHVRDVLEFLCGFDIGVSLEILVSDNASEDDTEAVTRSFASRLPIRYVRQSSNIGAEANLMSAFRLAQGELCVYLGDDDRLIPSGMRHAVQRLLEKPERSAVLGPWEDWDECTDSSMGMHFTWPADQEGDQPDPVTMLSRFVTNKGFPEIGVYRTRLLHKVLCLPHQVYWAQPWVGRLSGEGPVYVQSSPFYRSLARTKARRDRLRLGVEQTMMFQDRYRGGLEVGLWEGIRQSGATHLSVEREPEITALVERLQAGRLRVGAYLSGKVGDHVRAVEFGRRARLYTSQAAPTDEEAGRVQATRDRDHLLQQVAEIPAAAPAPELLLSLCFLCDKAPEALVLPDLPDTEYIVVSRETITTPDPRIRYLSAAELYNDGRRRLVGLSLARGRYVAALPAGAMVLTESLRDVIETMEQLPEARAWMTTSQPEEGQTVAYGWEEAMEQFMHLVSSDFHPDFCLYRREGLAEVLFPTQTIAPSWQWWGDLSRRGQVCLSPIPWLQTRPVAESPDTLRGALELLLYEVLEHSCLEALSIEDRVQIRQLLNQRLLPCLHDNAVSLAERGDAMGALELLARRQLWLKAPHPLKDGTPLLDAAAAGLVRTAATRTATFSGLVLCGIELPMLEGSILSSEAEILAAQPSSMVLVPDIATAERLRTRLLPGQVLVWSELRRLVQRLV